MRRWLVIGALLVGGLSCSPPAGLRVDVQFGSFGADGRSLRYTTRGYAAARPEGQRYGA